MIQGRNVKYFICWKCGKSNPDYLTFGVGERRNYCLNHKPIWARIEMYLKSLWKP
jgi:hypothetical protein